MSEDHLLNIRAAYRTLGQMLEGIDWTVFDKCECGHRRLEHIPPRLFPEADGREPCRSCGCTDFDDLHVLRAAA